MTNGKALHPRDDIDRLCVKKKGGRGLADTEDSANTSIRRIEDYQKKTKNPQKTKTNKG